MKKSFVFILLAASATLFGAGCAPRTVSEFAKALRQDVGVKVAVRTDDGDACMEQQLRALYEEIRNLPKEKRKSVVEKLKTRFDWVILWPSKTRQTVRGELVELYFYTRELRFTGPSYYHYEQELDRKTLLDSRFALGLSGTIAQAQNHKGQSLLSIAHQSVRDESIRKTYATRNWSCYQESEDIFSPAFSAGRQNGDIELKAEDAVVRLTCGPMLKLENLLKL